MIEIAKACYKNDTVHKIIGTKEYYGNISCGFLHKKYKQDSNVNTVFENYGGLLLISGKGRHIDDKGKEYALFPGCFVQRIPGKLHHTYIEPDGRWLEFFICFGRDTFENMVNMGIATKDEDVLYPGVSYALIKTLEELLKKFKNATEKELPLLLFECQKIIYHIYTLHEQNESKENEQMIEACNLLKKYATSRVAIEEICIELGVGYEKFRKTFKHKMGMAPSQYMVKERINLAKGLLLAGNHSIKEISISLGYTDPFTFSNQFKEVTGVSPKEFKRIY
ncbi:MAG: helix-turn-helix domain-containing protein [Cellulosilyticaceae bacterium]